MLLCISTFIGIPKIHVYEPQGSELGIPRVSADREHLSTLHGAGVDENDFACRGLPEAIALVDEPFVDEHLHGLRLVRKGLLKVGFALGIIGFVLL